MVLPYFCSSFNKLAGIVTRAERKQNAFLLNPLANCHNYYTKCREL